MATAAVASWLNGERTVVALFVARVLFSLPSSLLPHGLALSLLAISALVLDILADSSASLSQFNTRSPPRSISAYEIRSIRFLGFLFSIQLKFGWYRYGIGISMFQAGCFVRYTVRGRHIAHCYDLQNDTAFTGFLTESSCVWRYEFSLQLNSIKVAYEHFTIIYVRDLVSIKTRDIT